MDTILRDATTDQLASAIQGSLLGFFRLLGRDPGTEFREENGISRWRTGIAHPLFNGVISARLPRGDEGALIQDTIAYFRTRGVGGITWWLEPGMKGVGWEDALVKAGLRREADTPGMALDLNALAPAAVPAGLSIRAVDDLPGLRTWGSVFVPGYGLPLDWEAPLFNLFGGIGLGLPLRHYIGYLDEQPVSTASLFLGAGAAGIYNIATLPEARGRGIGAALTLAPLQDAREMGFRYGVLQSSEMGFPVYRRLGFEQLCVMEHYYWEK